MRDVRKLTDAEAETACLEALEALEARQPETKMNRANDLDPEGYYYVRAGLEDVTQEKIEQAARGFRQAHKDLGIPLDDFLTLVWVKRVSAAEYKQAGSRTEDSSRRYVQGWYSTRDKKIRLDVNAPDIQRTALHEAYHVYQDRQGRANGLNPQVEVEAEAYAQKAYHAMRASAGGGREQARSRLLVEGMSSEQARFKAAYELMIQEIKAHQDKDWVRC